ncbi:MAG: flagellar protein [Firmicutes bacterium]|nr:flagellar protein [Bacillota bacterium]
MRPGSGPARGVGGHIEPFDSVLRAAVAEQGIKFSAHAEARMRLRNIRLSSRDVAKLNTAVAKAAAKGAKESLVLMDRLALVVSIENRTVITAIDSASARENVFTNIDSAVII